MLKKTKTVIAAVRGWRFRSLLMAAVAIVCMTMVSCGDEPGPPPPPGGYYDTYYLEGYYEGQYRDGAILAWMFYSDGSGYNRWVNVPSNPYSNTFRTITYAVEACISGGMATVITAMPAKWSSATAIISMHSLCQTIPGLHSIVNDCHRLASKQAYDYRLQM